ncbi:MAG: hypothetical protein ACN4F7_00950 [Candidatus Puniceispirillaceae bacterium]|nr:hypothetical protein [Alphaproteobacteria bacterium]MDB0028224.1 hypothetical protein [Alphaproteobacteria bacterium]
MRRLLSQCGCLILIMLLSGCQMFVDNRKEALLVISADQWTDMQLKVTELEKITRARNKPVALPGSELIAFTSETDAYLAGCRKLGIVEVHHYGTYDEAVILIRNQAFKMEASVIAPLDAYQDKSPLITEDSRLNFIQGRILRCPKTDILNEPAVNGT